MKNYKFKNLKLGQKDFFRVKINNKLLRKFINLSGDRSEIHSNKNFAKKYGFKDKVVHGMLLGALYSRFVGLYLPGKFSLLISIHINFIKPVYLNDTIHVKGKIIHLNKSYKIATVKIEAHNKSKSKISTAKAMVKLNE